MASLLFNIFCLMCQFGNLYFIFLDPQRLNCESSALTFKSLIVTFSLPSTFFGTFTVCTNSETQSEEPQKLFPTNNRKSNLGQNKVQCQKSIFCRWSKDQIVFQKCFFFIINNDKVENLSVGVKADPEDVGVTNKLCKTAISGKETHIIMQFAVIVEKEHCSQCSISFVASAQCHNIPDLRF